MSLVPCPLSLDTVSPGHPARQPDNLFVYAQHRCARGPGVTMRCLIQGPDRQPLTAFPSIRDGCGVGLAFVVANKKDRDDPQQAIVELLERGAHLTHTEIAALIATDVRLWARTAESIDPRLQKASLKS